MGALMSKADVARLRDVTPAAVSRAIKKGRLFATPGGEIDLSDPRNVAYLMGTRAPGRPKGSRTRKPHPTPRQPTAPDPDEVGEGDGDELPPDAFVAPEGSGVVYLGRVQAQRKRIISAIKLFEHRAHAYRAQHVPAAMVAAVVDLFLDRLAAAMAASDLSTDWNDDNPVAAIDSTVDGVLDPLRNSEDFKKLPTSMRPREARSDDDDLESLPLEELRAVWDEGHSFRHEVALAIEKGELILWEDAERRFAALGSDVKSLFLDLGRRVGPRLSALAASAGPDAATQALRRELEEAVQRMQRHRFTPPG